MIVSLLRHKIDSFKSKFDNMTEEIDNLDFKMINYMKLEYATDYDRINLMEEYTSIKNDINNLVTDINDLFKDKNCGIPTPGFCEFSGHCDACSEYIDDGRHINYCVSRCDQCLMFRKYKEKEAETKIKQYYDEHISQKPVSKNIVQQKKNPTIIVNNLTINNNIIKNYINTKDLFFYVNITSNKENAEEKLRYIFTYLMCGCYARQIFPGETRYSKALTFPVFAAKYNIITSNKKQEPKYTLHGLLRYKYRKESSMTVKKLQSMGDNDHVVKVYVPNICNNNKAQLLKDDIDIYINNLINSEHGSNLDNFYIEDIE